MNPSQVAIKTETILTVFLLEVHDTLTIGRFDKLLLLRSTHAKLSFESEANLLHIRRPT